jgi:phenylpyruvate tautomerase PptA (4-oxalocrotonate tautomerase family)
MPVITIQVTRARTKPGAHSVSAEEKAALIKGASQLLFARPPSAPRAAIQAFE